MTNPLQQQVGGNHYKTGGIQPVELGYANQYDACIFSAIKYVSRYRRKGGVEDLKKAMHFVDLRLEMMKRHGHSLATEKINISEYCQSNGIEGQDAFVVVNLHHWAVCSEPHIADVDFSAMLKRNIEFLIATYQKEPRSD